MKAGCLTVNYLFQGHQSEVKETGMSKFRVGLTRDFLNADGKLNYEIGLELFAENPNIEYEFFTDFSPEVTPDQIAVFDAVISLMPRYTKDSFAGVKRLTAIARCGVGYDMVDLKACSENDILCFITPQGVRRPVAVSVLAFVLSLSSRLLEKDALIRAGKWDEKTDYMGWGVTGKTIGSVGLGGIAQEFFKLAKPLDITMIAYDPFVQEKEARKLGVAKVDLETLLRESDFLCINVPLTEDTHHLIGEEELGLMKPSAFLINTARGPIADQKALTKALQERTIRGAALDVFEIEPIDPSDPLLKLDNVILTPHGIAWTDEMFRGMGEADVRGILEVAKGRIPDNVVNKDVLEKAGFKKKLARFL